MTTKRIRSHYYILSGLFWFSTALIVSLYVLFLIEKGMSLVQVGLWGGTSTLTVILMEIPTGGLADSWGRGKTYALANMVISMALLLMSLIPGIAVLYIGAVLYGIGRALSSGSLDAWFIDAMKDADPTTNVEKELGAAEGVVLAALAVGSLIGASLPGWFAAHPAPFNLSPMAIPLSADAAVKLSLAALTMVFVKDAKGAGSPLFAIRKTLGMAPGIARTAVTTVRGHKELGWLFAGGAGLALGTGAVESFWQPRFLSLTAGGPGRTAFGVVMACCFAAAGAFSLVTPRITRLLGGKRHRSALLLSLLVSGCLFALARTGSVRGMAVWMVLLYAFGGGAGIPRRAMLNDILPTEVRATMLSVDSLMTYIGFAGTVSLGYLAEAKGIPAAWIVASMAVGLLALAYVPLRRRNAATVLIKEASI